MHLNLDILGEMHQLEVKWDVKHLIGWMSDVCEEQTAAGTQGALRGLIEREEKISILGIILSLNNRFVKKKQTGTTPIVICCS